MAMNSKTKALSLDSSYIKSKITKRKTVEEYKIDSDYEIESLIGTGTYSNVFQAIKKSNGWKVAIKEWRGETKGEYLK